MARKGAEVQPENPKTESRNPRLPLRAVRVLRGHLPLLSILAAYAVLAVAVQAHCAELLSSDGECYLRMAAAYARGDFRHALFGHWSPLGAWMAAPLVAVGMSPRIAFRVMIGLWGALCVVGTWRLARRLADHRFQIPDSKSQFASRRSQISQVAAAACAALLAVEFSADHRVDLLLAAALLFYLDAATDERLLRSRRWALWVGALGGIAYLAKLYALPFVAAHFTLTVLLRSWSKSRITRHALRSEYGVRRAECGMRAGMWNLESGMPLRCAALAWAFGALGLALVAAPWVAVLSAKYGRLTFGTAAATSYALVGPGSGDARQQAITGLRRPPDDAPNVWQDATREPPIPATPPQLVGIAEKLRLAGGNAVKILGHIARLDEFRLGLVALALLPIALMAAWRDLERAFGYAALLLAVLIFCGGYAFIQAENERYFWFVFFVLTAAAFHFVGLAPEAVGRLGAGRRERALVGVVAAVLAAASFGFHPVRSVAELLRQPPPGREHRLMAERLRARGIAGPLASSNWHDGLHTAFYLDAKYAGMPAARDPAGIVAEMRAAGATTLLVWRDEPLARALRGEPGGLRFVESAAKTELQSPRGGAWVFALP